MTHLPTSDDIKGVGCRLVVMTPCFDVLGVCGIMTPSSILSGAITYTLL